MDFAWIDHELVRGSGARTRESYPHRWVVEHPGVAGKVPQAPWSPPHGCPRPPCPNGGIGLFLVGGNRLHPLRTATMCDSSGLFVPLLCPRPREHHDELPGMTGNEIVGHGVAVVPPPRPTTYLLLGETRGRAVPVAGESRRSARRRRGCPSRRSGSRAGLPFDAASMKIETGLVSGSRRSMGTIWVTGGVGSDPRKSGSVGSIPTRLTRPTGAPITPWWCRVSFRRPSAGRVVFSELSKSPGREVAPRLNSRRCGTRRRGPADRAGRSCARCCGACGHE